MVGPHLRIAHIGPNRIRESHQDDEDANEAVQSHDASLERMLTTEAQRHREARRERIEDRR
jgi:hypothetical protein